LATAGDTIAEPQATTSNAWANDLVECDRIGMTGSGQRVMREQARWAALVSMPACVCWLLRVVPPARWRCRVLEDEAREALLASPLGGLPVDVRHALCRDAVMIDVPAGSHVFRNISDMVASVVVRGVIRVYVVRHAVDPDSAGMAATAAPILTTSDALAHADESTVAYLGDTEPVRTIVVIDTLLRHDLVIVDLCRTWNYAERSVGPWREP
jgi:hypothetical protein